MWSTVLDAVSKNVRQRHMKHEVTTGNDDTGFAGQLVR